jgi:type IV pilus assembly protein PilB
MAQRLVRLICVECRRPAKITADDLRESGLDPALAETHEFFEGAGCIDCGGTGFRGRTALCELLDLTDDLREMILAQAPASQIKQAMRAEGMRFLRDSAVEKAVSGVTALQEINKVTFVK